MNSTEKSKLEMAKEALRPFASVSKYSKGGCLSGGTKEFDFAYETLVKLEED